ncbi:hypothetical protein [Bradyrhizobium sp. Ai1a-2]|uniref:hypothetical protein n=1 Tax=Bradyrhizobium sp. Ai1a-2 TaxID=196490 RepID=UPI000403CC59|nr:hypothetical protein [Bradyrhizobium sp. Ai1a-2]
MFDIGLREPEDLEIFRAIPPFKITHRPFDGVVKPDGTLIIDHNGSDLSVTAKFGG